MEESSELRDLLLQFIEALNNGDFSFIDNLFSQKDEVLLIGTDPNEWWTGYNTIINVFKTQLGEMGVVDFSLLNMGTYSEGKVGWAASQGIMKLPDDLEIPFRSTFIFHQEDGSWKIIQMHSSIGVLNEDVLGHELTT